MRSDLRLFLPTSPPSPALLRSRWALLAAGVALVLGVACALLPPDPAVVLLGGIALALCMATTPLAALVLTLTVAPLRTLIATESALRLPLDIGQIAFVLLLGSWLLYRVVAQRRLPRVVSSVVYLPVGLFLAATALTVFNAFSIASWLTEWLKWAQILLLVALCFDMGEQAAPWLVFALVVAASTNAIIGLYQFFGGSGALHLVILERYFRAFGTFGQPNPFGAFMGLVAPLAFASACGYTVQAIRHFRTKGFLPTRLLLIAAGYSGAFLLLSAGLFASYSRGAWLGFAVALVAVLFALPRRFGQSVLLLVLLIALFGVAWGSGRLPTSITERLSSAVQESFNLSDVRGVNITPENYALVERLAHWQAALNMARAHPWLGVGFGNYEIAYNQYRLLYWTFPLGHAHNYYLNILAETGLIGAGIYLILWGSIFVLTWRARRHPHPISRAWVCGLLGTWVYLSIHSLTDNLYVNNLFLHLGVMFGLLAVLYNAGSRFSRVHG